MKIKERLKNLPIYEPEFYKKKHNQKNLFTKDGKCYVHLALGYDYETEIFNILTKFNIFINMEFDYASRLEGSENPLYIKMNFQEVCRLVYDEVLNDVEYTYCKKLSYNVFKNGFMAYSIFFSNAALVIFQKKDQKELKIESVFSLEDNFKDYYKKVEVKQEDKI